MKQKVITQYFQTTTYSDFFTFHKVKYLIKNYDTKNTGLFLQSGGSASQNNYGDMPLAIIVPFQMVILTDKIIR